MRNQTKLYAILGVLAVFLGFVPVSKGKTDNLQAPQQIIQSVSDELQTKLHDSSFTKDFAQVTRFVDGVIDRHTDFSRIAPLVLAQHWKTATPDQQERFKQEFKTLLVRVYSRAFIEYNNWTIKFLPFDMPAGTSKIVVKTQVLQPGQQPVAVDYRMFLSQGEWKVYDILFDGVSLVANYRSIFNDEIQTKGSLTVVISDLAKRNSEALAAKN